ncbi:MAG: PQ-loop domain-containing transporter [Nitrosotalea sp.]
MSAESSPRNVRLLDRITFFAGVVGPFTILPQVYEIFSTKNASGVSLTSWILMFVVTLPWIFYGMAHKEKSIVVSFILWEVVNLFVIAGILMYS